MLRVVRHERRTSLTASPGCWNAYPVGVSAVLTLAPRSSPWRLQSAHGGTPAYVTDGDGRAGMRGARSAVRGGFGPNDLCLRRVPITAHSVRSADLAKAGERAAGNLVA